MICIVLCQIVIVFFLVEDSVVSDDRENGWHNKNQTPREWGEDLGWKKVLPL